MAALQQRSDDDACADRICQKHHSTQGVAERIASRLHQRGLPADIPAIRDAKDVAAYDAVVIGVERSDRSDRSGQRIAWPITSKLTHPDRA
jgi:hypothetical protein